MTTRELMRWAAFERVHGPILVHERVDTAGAIVASTVAKLGETNASPADFLPRWDSEGAGGDPFAAFEALAALGERAGGDD